MLSVNTAEIIYFAVLEFGRKRKWRFGLWCWELYRLQHNEMKVRIAAFSCDEAWMWVRGEHTYSKARQICWWFNVRDLFGQILFE